MQTGIIIAIIIVILIIVIASSGPTLKSGDRIISVECPNPETCTDKFMIDFIAETPNYKLDAVFKKYVELGYTLKPLYLEACKDKLSNNYIYRKSYYELAGIYEDPPITIEDYIYERRLEIEKLSSEYQNTFTFEVAGVHLPHRKSHIRNHCNELDVVELIPESSNKFDKNAIKVRCNNKLIGYVPADETSNVHNILENDFYTYIDYINDDDGFIDVEILILY